MSDSEESDGEGGLGNLNRLIVRPPGHSGKAKRGQLCFDAAFECGNLGRADHISELEYDLFIRPDTCRPRARFWFNFTVENVRQDQRVIFNIVNLGKERTLYCGEMTPLVRSTSRHKWQRIPRRLLFYHRSAVHRGRRILSFAFAFDREEDVYQFAAAAPYSYSRLQKHLALWEKRAQTFATREVIAHTLHKRRVDLITIGDFNIKEREVKEDQTPLRGKTAELKKRVVIIIARVHGGEPPASYICQGFLDYMISSSEKAQALRNGIVLKVIPMLNPDGVFLGNQRSDVLGSDMNRCWHRATTFAHPALIAVNEALNKLYAEKTLQLDFIIDLHADISNEGVFVRGNSYDDVYRFERHAVLPKFLAGRVEAWRTDGCFYNMDPCAAGSARRVLPAAAVDAYSLLASLGGRRLTAKGPYLHYTEDSLLPKFLAGRVEAWRTDGCFYNMDPCAAGSARRVLPAAAVDAYSLLASLGGRRLTAKGPFERHAVLPKFLAGRVEAWRTDGCFYNMDPCAAGSARRVLPAAAVDAYSLLASLGGRRLTAKGPYLHYTEDSYFKIGRSLAKSLCDYYRHIGVIPPREGVLKKKKGQRGRHRRRRPITERDRSPSTSRERRPLRPRVVSPPLPPASPPPLRAPPPFRHLHHPARPRTVPDLHPILPLITGTAVRTPRLAVLNMSAYIRSPGGGGGRRGNRTRPRLAKPPRPYHPKITSDEYDTHDSDS